MVHTCPNFVICSLCGSKSCINCVEQLCNLMRNDNVHQNDRWYNDIQDILKGKKETSSFVGHCCEIKLQVEEAAKSAKKQNNNKDVAISDGDNGFYKAGLLHFPQLHILVDSPLVDYVDVHGLGKEECQENEKPGLLHAVTHQKIRNKSIEYLDKKIDQSTQCVSYTTALGKKTQLLLKPKYTN